MSETFIHTQVWHSPGSEAAVDLLHPYSSPASTLWCWHQQELVHCVGHFTLANLTTSLFSLSSSPSGFHWLSLSASVRQHNKSRHVPTRHQQPTGCMSLLLDQRGRSRGSERGGNPERTQHDSACCFNGLAYTAFTLNTFTRVSCCFSVF